MATVHQSFYVGIDSAVKLDRVRGQIPNASALRYLFNYILRQPDESVVAILQSEKINEKESNKKV